jgi:hypothetical protein
MTFFTACDAAYLVNCLSCGIPSQRYDASTIVDTLCAQVLARRRAASQWHSRRCDDEPLWTAKAARDLWDLAHATHFWDDPWANASVFHAFFGEEWWQQLPLSPNPDYLYLERVVTAVQQAFVQLTSPP